MDDDRDETLLPLPEPDLDSDDRDLTEELLPDLSSEDEADLVRTIHRDVAAALLDRAELEEEWAQDERYYHQILPEKTWPWPGCANFCVPMTTMGIETLKPRLSESVLGGDPIVFVVPTEAHDEARQERVERYLNWQIRNELRLDPIVRQSAHLFLLPGTVVAKILWRVAIRKSRSIQRFAPDLSPDEMFRAIFGPLTPTMTQEGARAWTGEWKATPGGAPRKVRVKLKFGEDETLVLVEKDEIRYQGPQIDLIPTEDFIAPVRGMTDIQGLPWCTHRLWYDEQTLRQKVALGRFFRDSVQDLLEQTRPSGENAQQDATALREVRAATEAVAADAASSVRDTQWEVYEDYRHWDLDGDGIDEEIVTWSCPQLPDRLLGWDYLDNVYAHGMRPFERGVYWDEPLKFYGGSFARLVRGLQEEINTIRNQKVDFATLRNTPAGWVRGSSTMDPGIHPMRPGEFRPIDNPAQDVQPMIWGGSDSWGDAEEAMLWQVFERLTGITDLALGRQPNRVGATRTATGVASLLSEAGLRFKTSMQAFQDFWSRVLTQVHMLNQQFIPPGKEFRVTGRWPEVIRIQDRTEIAGKYDLRLSATSESLNRQIQREDATIKLQAAMNPLWMQMGLIGVKGFYRLLRAFLRAYGESDPDMVLDPPRDLMAMTPDQELAAILAGESVKANVVMNLAEHINVHGEQLATPVILQQLGAGGVEKLRKLLGEEIQLAQMQAMAMSMQQQQGGGGAGAVGAQAVNGQAGQQYAQGMGNGAPGPMAGQLTAQATSNRAGR